MSTVPEVSFRKGFHRMVANDMAREYYLYLGDDGIIYGECC